MCEKCIFLVSRLAQGAAKGRTAVREAHRALAPRERKKIFGGARIYDFSFKMVATYIYARAIMPPRIMQHNTIITTA